jgi:hypothetical protein
LTAVAALGATACLAQSRIGTASAIRNQVEGIIAGSTKVLSAGSDVFQDEGVRTGEESQVRLLFLDATTLSVGPKSEVRLDRFVFNPDQATRILVVNAGRGVFRFVTGSQGPHDYTIQTPVATIGVRGTDFHLLVDGDKITAALVSGLLRIVTNRGRVLTLTPGMAVTIFANGRVQGPMPWRGPITRYASNVPFPYFGTGLTVAGPSPVIPSRVVRPSGGVFRPAASVRFRHFSERSAARPVRPRGGWPARISRSRSSRH